MEPIEAEHIALVNRLTKDPKQVKQELTAQDCDLIHCVMGMSGEMGELLDAVKKAVIYRKPLDLVNVVEELGDIEFYMQRFRTILTIAREDTLRANVAKLKKRYGDSYSDSAAQLRADKS